MQNKPDIYEILERAHKGEYCTAKDWDIKKINGTIRKVLKEYNLEHVCDVNNPINTDYALADRFYQAGFDLALRLGFWVEDTERIIAVSQEELENALKFAPAQVFVGEGKDGTWIKSRTPGDASYPCQQACSLGITVSEDIYMQLVTGIAAEREVDILEAGSLTTVRGHEVLSGTPWETLMGYVHGQMQREARRRAGRPGMGGIGSISATTEFGQFGAYGTPGGFLPTDLALILFPSEMKIDYRTLNKVVHTLNMGGMVKADSPAMIGGMPGSPEGAVISNVACSILSYAILQNHVGGGEIYDVRYLANVNREGLWALGMVTQALSRNTHILLHNISNDVSGPCTKTLLYEIAAGQATLASCGSSVSTGPRTAGGKLNDYITPLECRFTAEVTHKASGMDPKDVNEVVKKLLPLYEDNIKTPNLGKPYQKAYDVTTGKPTDEWMEIYDTVKKEVREMGIPLDNY
jgi:methylamine--corrinoid protein Co-methyltransferase